MSALNQSLSLHKKVLLVASVFTCVTSSVVFASNNAFQNWQTSNGAEVYYYQSDDLPMLDLRLVFRAGSARDGDKPGVAEMTSSLISSGAGDMDANALATAFDNVGAQFNSGSARDMAWITLRTLTIPEMLEKVVSVIEKVATVPNFPEDELELMRAQLLTGLKNDEQDPGDIARKAFNKALFGDHPYGVSYAEDDIMRLTREDIVAFYKQYYVAKNAQLAIVGQLDRKQAQEIAERIAGGLASGTRAAKLPPVQSLKEAKTIRIKYPSAQSHILIGQPGIKRGDSEHLPLYIANHGFGGSGFASILMDEVREKRGLAYSVYSYSSPMAERGPFVIGLQTRNDQVDEALSVVMENLRDFTENGPTDDTFESSIMNITGGSPMKTDTNGKIAQYASSIGFYGLPLDYLDTFNDKIRAETRDSSALAFKAIINPEKLITVVVGGGEK